MVKSRKSKKKNKKKANYFHKYSKKGYNSNDVPTCFQGAQNLTFTQKRQYTFVNPSIQTLSCSIRHYIH